MYGMNCGLFKGKGFTVDLCQTLYQNQFAEKEICHEKENSLFIIDGDSGCPVFALYYS
jgi:hypothetical protein